MQIPFIKYSKVWLAMAVLTVAVSLAMLLTWRLKPGIDFTGGSLMEISFSGERPAGGAVTEIFQAAGFSDSIIQKSGEHDFIIRSKFLTEEQHQDILQQMRAKLSAAGSALREDRFETIGGSVSQQLRRRALSAVAMVSLGIIAYMAYAFRKVTRPVASWKYGILAIVAMLHDIALVLGVFAFLGRFYGVEIDVPFVVALLTVLGYSVNDTIVVYDRIREHLSRHSADNFSAVVNQGLNDTLMRSLNTTLTTLLPLFALYFLGGSTVHYFALALIIGMASGAYSSIFVASPLLVMAERWQRRTAR